MKRFRFVIKEQDEMQISTDVPTADEIKSEINNLIADLDQAQLPAVLAFIKNIQQNQNKSTLEEKKNKKNCFSHNNYKTFNGKSKCIQDTKGLTKEKADAYVSSVLRDMGELPKKKKK